MPLEMLVNTWNLSMDNNQNIHLILGVQPSSLNMRAFFKRKPLRLKGSPLRSSAVKAANMTPSMKLSRQASASFSSFNKARLSARAETLRQETLCGMLAMSLTLFTVPSGVSLLYPEDHVWLLLVLDAEYLSTLGGNAGGRT